MVRDKTLMERLLDNEVQPPLDKSILYNDNGRSFTNILLYGQEWNLVLFDVLLFCMVDWWAGWDYVLAAVCVYFADIPFMPQIECR